MNSAAAAFLRFSRDRRGYEHFYLVQPTTNRRGKTRTRILYWFRTPPGVKVGRLPFDDDMRRAIEAQNPGVAFDWKKLLATPIPPPAPDVERWRERRRVERAERAARKIELAPEVDPEVDLEVDSDQPGAVYAGAPGAPDGLGADDRLTANAEVEPESEPASADAPEGFEAQGAAAPPAGAEAASAPPPAAGKRRRRRRGGRRNQRPANSNPPTSNGGTKL
jgi:hypothetical protein